MYNFVIVGKNAFNGDFGGLEKSGDSLDGADK